MLTGSMMEARQDHVTLKGVSAHAVQTLLDFAYSGACVGVGVGESELTASECHAGGYRTTGRGCCINLATLRPWTLRVTQPV